MVAACVRSYCPGVLAFDVCAPCTIKQMRGANAKRLTLHSIRSAALKQDTVNKCFVLDASKASLENTEGFDKDHWPNFADRALQTKVHEHYKTSPYWMYAARSRVIPDRQPERAALCGLFLCRCSEVLSGIVSFAHFFITSPLRSSLARRHSLLRTPPWPRLAA